MNDNVTMPQNATPEKTVVLACDVSKADVHVYSVVGGRPWRSKMPNTTAGLAEGLSRFREVAGATKLVVVMESTGSYHENLDRVAESLGMETAWVKAEAVAKMRVVVHGDQGKSDPRDPEVIHTLADRIARHPVRKLPLAYRRMREWHRILEAAEERVVALKCTIHTVMQRLFPDFDFGVDFLYGPSGQALAKTYGCNPHRIAAERRGDFRKRMKQAAPRIQARSLDRLFTSAKSSVVHAGEEVADIMELRVRQLFEDLEREEQKLHEAGTKLEELFLELKQQDPALPSAVRGVATTRQLARVIAETGPLSDFQSWRAVMRYAGFNLTEKQSGKSRGRTKASKKGRRLLRKVLTHAALPLVRRDRLYGPYFHAKRKAGMPGAKAMVAVARKFLKMLWGWHRSANAFNPERVFASQVTERKAA